MTLLSVLRYSRSTLLEMISDGHLPLPGLVCSLPFLNCLWDGLDGDSPPLDAILSFSTDLAFLIELPYLPYFLTRRCFSLSRFSWRAFDCSVNFGKLRFFWRLLRVLSFDSRMFLEVRRVSFCCLFFLTSSTDYPNTSILPFFGLRFWRTGLYCLFLVVLTTFLSFFSVSKSLNCSTALAFF